MQKLAMTFEQLESWTAQYKGDRSDIFYDGENLNYPDDLSAEVEAIDVSAPSLPFQMRAYAAAKRFQIETGGITVNGALVDTSRDSQNMINGAYNYAKANPTKTISFKATSGWVAITADEAIAIGSAVGDHVQTCFANEAAVDAAITSGAITTMPQIDAFAWPPNG